MRNLEFVVPLEAEIAGMVIRYPRSTYDYSKPTIVHHDFEVVFLSLTGVAIAIYGYVVLWHLFG